MNYKSLTKEQAKEIFSDVNFKTDPMWHQYVTMAWALDKNEVFLAMGIGTGKSLTSLYINELWNTKKILIVCPNSVINSWENQILEHTKYKPIVLRGTKEERRKLILKKKKGIFVINYEGLLPLLTDTFELKKQDKIEKKKIIVKNVLKQLGVDSIIVDESHNCKNKDALQAQICAEISRVCDKVICMTGTITSKDEKDLFYQYYVLNQGQSLGGNYYKFLNKFFRKTKWNWIPKKGSRQKILNLVKNVTIRFSREECLDLPEKIYEKREIFLTKEQNDCIIKQVNEIIDDINESNVVTKTNKLSQIAGGFLYTNEGTIRLNNNKIKELSSILEEMNEKVIIFHEYVEEGRIIEEVCDKLKISYASMRSEIKDKKEQEEKFKNDANCQVLIAHPDSAGVGTDGFQNVCNTMIFYSNGYSYLGREQCEGRIIRSGQKNNCVYIDLICVNSIDERKLNILKKKKDNLTDILDYIRNFKQ